VRDVRRKAVEGHVDTAVEEVRQDLVVPLYGTCVSSIAAACWNISPVRWISAPTPEEAKVYLPGLAFARATNSFTEPARDAAGTTNTMVP
jgi:hypothetical protein